MITSRSMPNTAPDKGSPSRQTLHVAAAVIYSPLGRILIARRPLDKHQGGLWEFPGGKVELNETARQALDRELLEELGIQVTAAQPLIQIPYEYPERHVLLDVFSVTAFKGEARGCEGQPLAWVDVSDLVDYPFPAANQPILDRIIADLSV
ncbi:8-oxo-dGTP diphosphatase MutT [Nitrincola sp. A-D6]|uniref:8-oxo-dGTP diphosphatase MutT n=1 Tax=Nitrincola sp. A-D6 TaxID=1545442 RepID=UPI001F34F348|nr:8-oxo-dGTP diphosphatase MutT [Nitrincola sp. A-D6]